MIETGSNRGDLHLRPLVSVRSGSSSVVMWISLCERSKVLLIGVDQRDDAVFGRERCLLVVSQVRAQKPEVPGAGGDGERAGSFDILRAVAMNQVEDTQQGARGQRAAFVLDGGAKAPQCGPNSAIRATRSSTLSGVCFGRSAAMVRRCPRPVTACSRIN